jgi:hypothetical protein
MECSRVSAYHRCWISYADSEIAGLPHESEQQPIQSTIQTPEPLTSTHLNSIMASSTSSPVAVPNSAIPVSMTAIVAPAATTVIPPTHSASPTTSSAAAVLSDAARTIITEQAGKHLEELKKLISENGAKSFYRERLMTHSIMMVEQIFFPPPSLETEGRFNSGSHQNITITRNMINEWAREHGYPIKASTAANHKVIWGRGATQQLHLLQAADRASPNVERGDCMRLLELIIKAVYIGPSPDIGSIEAKALQLNQKAWHRLMKTGNFLAVE